MSLEGILTGGLGVNVRFTPTRGLLRGIVPPITLLWSDYSKTKIEWGSQPDGEGTAMIQDPLPIRRLTSVLLQYTFRDHLNAVIDLSAYTTIKLYVKAEGETVVELTAQFISKPAGTVKYVDYAFTPIGIWNAQFVATTLEGKKLHGAVIQFRVAKNVSDLDLTELAQY